MDSLVGGGTSVMHNQPNKMQHIDNKKIVISFANTMLNEAITSQDGRAKQNNRLAM